MTPAPETRAVLDDTALEAACFAMAAQCDADFSLDDIKAEAKENPEKFEDAKRLTAAGIRAYLAAAPAAPAPEDEAEHFIQAAIDSAPEPLRRLGAWLADMLDEGDWKTADQLVTGAAVSLARATPPAPVAASARECRHHAVELEQCAIFAADVGPAIAKAMTDAATFLRALSSTPPAPAAPAQKPHCWEATDKCGKTLISYNKADSDRMRADYGWGVIALYAALPAPVAASAVEAGLVTAADFLLDRLGDFGRLVDDGASDNERAWIRHVVPAMFRLRRALAATPASPNPVAASAAGAPRVKALEWHHLDNGDCWAATTIGLAYHATSEGWRHRNGELNPVEGCLEAAKAAAQADYERRVRACLEPGQATHRHVKRGTLYRLLGIGNMQTLNWVTTNRDGFPIPIDDEEVAIYVGVDNGLMWVRPRAEFEDGRFNPLPPAAEGK